MLLIIFFFAMRPDVFLSFVNVRNRFSPAAALPQGRNRVSTYIPVARVSDLLLIFSEP